MEPLSTSDLIFPSASKSIHTTLTNLKRANLSITNRLQSIHNDADFVSTVEAAYQLPLVANERCGSWYIPPERKAESVYFKSTDGHAGQWSLNLRRLNLHLLDVVGKAGGCIIVDSTRRGKSMPDALSKTVPIWISVLNRFLFPENEEVRALKTPEDVISRSEHAQVEERLPLFVKNLQDLGLNIDSLRAKLHGKPLEPTWVTQESEVASQVSIDLDRNLVVLCTASGRTASSTSASYDYVQGAADDSESWACGLSAVTFWAHRELLLSTAEERLPAVIEALMSERNSHPEVETPIAIGPSNIAVGTNGSAELVFATFDLVITCSEQPSTMLATKLGNRYLHLACPSGKVGSRKLRQQLPKLRTLSEALRNEQNILVTCHSGRDLAVGVALAVVCFKLQQNGAKLTKATIKQQLSWIMLSMPRAAPSGATLQSVNAFLLGQQSSQRP